MNEIYNPPAIAQYLTEDGSNAVQEVADPLKPSPLLQHIDSTVPQAQEQIENTNDHPEGEMSGLIQPEDTQNASSSSFYHFLTNDDGNASLDPSKVECTSNSVNNEILNTPTQPLEHNVETSNDNNETLNISQPSENNQDPPQNESNDAVNEEINVSQPPLPDVNEPSNIPQSSENVPNEESKNLKVEVTTTEKTKKPEDDQVQEV